MIWDNNRLGVVREFLLEFNMTSFLRDFGETDFF